jgi:hypothetical protein
MNIVADNYVAMFNLIQMVKRPIITDALMNSRINSFKQELKRTGTDRNSINMDMISSVPKYEIQTENRSSAKPKEQLLYPDPFPERSSNSTRNRN